MAHLHIVRVKNTFRPVEENSPRIFFQADLIK